MTGSLLRLVGWLADLRLAIVLLVLVAVASGLGTAIPQKESEAFYLQRYDPAPWLGLLRGHGVLALQLDHDDRHAVLEALHQRGWLYLYDGRGLGPLDPSALPHQLTGLQDDPYRSLVWKLKKEKVIDAEPLIPFHEFRWGAWLRSRALPPFSSEHLEPALPAARALARSNAAAHLAGWRGPGR